METRKYNVYKFDELDEKQKEKVMQNLYDINVNHDWWEFTYDGAKTIGLEIKSFDLDRNRHCKIAFIDRPETVIEKIIAEHGNMCETHKTAASFKKLFDELNEDNEDYDEKCGALIEDLQHDLEENYSKILQDEYEYQMTGPAIIETIEANDYDFTENGKID